MSGKLAGKR